MPTPQARSTGTPGFIDLEVPRPDASRPAFLSARLIPDRALMMLQARVGLADGREVDLLAAPEAAMATALLDGGPQDFMGNASFSFGAAILAPYANRIRGTYRPEDGTIETRVEGRLLRLPANGGGKAPGAERYAIHGLILDKPVQDLQTSRQPRSLSATGWVRAGDFGFRWPSSTDIRIGWTLRPEALSLDVTVFNRGTEALPIGLGWHPYFALPSARRKQARLRLPGRSRLAVNNYDEVLPTGRIEPVAGTRFDFRAAGGACLGEHYLDDCFVDLDKTAAGQTVCELVDPAARYGLRITALSEQVTAIQTFAPPDRPYVVIEPQFNWANPYGPEWPADRHTGMVRLEPHQTVAYAARLELFEP